MREPLWKPSAKIAAMEESATLKMAGLSRALKSKGAHVIDLSLGEPDFATPTHIQEVGIQAIRDGFSKYTPVAGLQSLREAVCTKLKRDNGLEYHPDQIVVSTGAKQSLINVVLCSINPGDEVLVPTPYWVSYAAMVQLAEGVMVNIHAGVAQDFKITPAQLEAAITERTKMFIFSSPCNPSGSVYTAEELEGLAVVFRKHPNILVVSDEIYELILFEGRHVSIATLEGMKDRVVVVNGCSKGFAMTGWRIGYIAAPLAIAKACNKMQGQFTSGTCAVAQKAAEAALLSDYGPSFAMRDAFLKRRNLMISLLKEIPGIRVNEPPGAFYVFPDIHAFLGKSSAEGEIRDSDDLALYLLEQAHVATVGGAAFGAPQGLRLSYATGEANIVQAVERISKALMALI